MSCCSCIFWLAGAISQHGIRCLLPMTLCNPGICCFRTSISNLTARQTPSPDTNRREREGIHDATYRWFCPHVSAGIHMHDGVCVCVCVRARVWRGCYYNCDKLGEDSGRGTRGFVIRLLQPASRFYLIGLAGARLEGRFSIAVGRQTLAAMLFLQPPRLQPECLPQLGLARASHHRQLGWCQQRINTPLQLIHWSQRPHVSK